eukprot:8791184-Pyramimonas_sp.AAC.1
MQKTQDTSTTYYAAGGSGALFTIVGLLVQSTWDLAAGPWRYAATCQEYMPREGSRDGLTENGTHHRSHGRRPTFPATSRHWQTN